MEDVYDGIVSSLVGRVYRPKGESRDLYIYSSHSDTKFVFRNINTNKTKGFDISDLGKLEMVTGKEIADLISKDN